MRTVSYPLPVAHHNLLEESKVYVDDCTIEHSEELIQAGRGEHPAVPERTSSCAAFHAQQQLLASMKSTVPEYAATLSVWQTMLEYMEDESFSYHRQVDGKWAGGTGARMRTC